MDGWIEGGEEEDEEEEEEGDDGRKKSTEKTASEGILVQFLEEERVDIEGVSREGRADA